ncbi:GmrSD restriction endonuclease domain-containing protein [Ensifer sp.]|jgi:hypothetical protein|uniref:GmrSD restriction endonuclease domain-containing protein n=1 Tax=Ensifer sp. TaxID=1872086 RepID=UPI002E0D56F0|nr:DUF262 domain-containing protein [Ensifer sp.]
MVAHVRGRLTTDPLNFEDIIADIRKGEIKIPKFQRPFVWKEDQAIKLVDSIARGYPVGSVLLWRTADKLNSERELGTFQLPQTDEMTPTKYVLDGQQRITVVYSAFGAAPTDPGFKPVYDLRNEAFHVGTDALQVHHFPLRYVYRTTDLLNFRTALQTLDDREVLQERLDALIGAITGYRIPVVELRDLTVEEVCPIFERINSSGTRLSTFDLIAAATWSKTFDLAAHAEGIASELAPKGFDGISNETILKCISVVLIESVKKEDVLRIRELGEQRISDATNRTKEALRKAIDLLQKEFSIQAMSFLPYEAHMICLTKVFGEVKSLDAAQLKRLRQWFWLTSFSEHFRGASEAFVTSSSREAVKWIVKGEGECARFGSAPTAANLIDTKFHFRAAVVKAYVIALAKAKPRNITNGATVDLVECLSSYNAKQFHHIFPQAWLKRENKKNIDSLANICMLAAAENLAVSDTPATEYIPRAISEHGVDVDDVFSANLMPSTTELDYSAVDYETFLKKRAEKIATHIGKLCEG